jgi:hypothetical protein
VTGLARGWARVAAGDEDQLARLTSFRAAHPEVVIGDLGFGQVWQARIPQDEDDGEQVVTRYTLRELLDGLGVIFPDLQDRAASHHPRCRASGGRSRPAGVGQWYR